MATVVALAFGSAGCGPDARSQGRPDPSARPSGGPTRSAAFHTCSAVRVDLPEGFHLVRRDLSALTDQRMGKVEIYRNGKRQIQLFTGTDVYDKLDDMDLVPHRIRVGRRAFDFSTTTIDTTLFIAQLEDERLEQPCDNVGMLTRHVSRSTFMRLLRTFQVDLPTP